MKTLATILVVLSLSININAQTLPASLNIEYEEISIDPAVLAEIEAQTGADPHCYRVYASIPANWELQINYGFLINPMSVSSTGPFYQNAFGGPTPLSIDPAELNAVPALNYDSWLTIGYDNNASLNLIVAPDASIFNGFEAGNGFVFNDIVGGSVSCPTEGFNPQNSPDANGRVLLAQFTTSGTVDACFNFQLRRLNENGTLYFDPNTNATQTASFTDVCFQLTPTPVGPQPCDFDFDSSGVIAINDLLVLLANFGCSSNCFIDINGDDDTQVEELLYFLSIFNDICDQ